MKFEVGDKVLSTTKSGMVFEAKVINIEGESLLLNFGGRIGTADAKDCRLKKKRIVYPEGSKRPSRGLDGPELFLA